MIKCTVKRSKKTSRSLSVEPKLWEQGFSIPIFIHEDFPELWRSQFRGWIPEVFHGRNIFYHYVDEWRDGFLRVMANKDDGAYSYLGNDSMRVGLHEPTMNFGFWDRGTFRHEMGHFVFARPHEHKHPDVIKLMLKDVVYEWVESWGAGWTKRDADQQILTPETSEGLLIKPYDERSNMGYGLPGKIFVDGIARGGNDNYSEMDNVFHDSLYPLRKEISKGDHKAALGTMMDYKYIYLRIPKTILQKTAEKLELDQGGSKKDIVARIRKSL